MKISDETYKRIEISNVLDVNDAAIYLGVSKRTIYRWVKECGFPYYRRGVRLMFSKQEMDDWQLSKLPEQADDNKKYERALQAIRENITKAQQQAKK